jgi:uncharacterized protein (DUF58 family)
MGAGLTLRGWVTVAGGLLWCGVAALFGQRDLAWPGFFLVVLPLVSWLLLLPGARRRVVRRVGPTELDVGRPVRSRLEVPGGRLALGAVADYRDAVTPGLGEAGTVSLPLGLGRLDHVIEQSFTTLWRGPHTLGPLRSRVGDGLGLARRRTELPGRSEVLALPPVRPLPGLRAAAGVGSSTETPALRASLLGPDDVLVREYHPGDDRRRIHWRASAHLGELMVRREERAWDPSAVLVLDNRGDSYSAARPEPRLEWLVAAAASIGCHLLEHGFGVWLLDTGRPEVDVRAVEGARDLRVRLARLPTTSSTSLTDALLTSPSGVRGQLLIALLGSLATDDALRLAEARREHGTCWALVHGEAAADALRVLADAGWRCVVAPPGADLAAVWRQFGEGDQ